MKALTVSELEPAPSTFFDTNCCAVPVTVSVFCSPLVVTTPVEPVRPL